MAIAYYRAILTADPANRSANDKGGLIAVGVGAGEAQGYLERLTSRGKVVVACINSPQSVTIAGDVTALEEVDSMCKEEGVFARRLKVDTAYHSHHMLPFAARYRDLLRNHLNEADTEHEMTAAFSSPVTGGRIARSRDIAEPEHWVKSLVQPVRFVEAFTDMVFGDDDADNSVVDVVVEVGPHSALAAPIREILSLPAFDGVNLPYWSCLVRNEHAGDTMLSLAVNLLREGVPLDMRQINFPRGYDDGVVNPRPRVLTDLPSYAWNHSIKHWRESRLNKAIRARSQQPHDLIGSPVPGANPETPAWRHILRAAETR